MTHVQSPKFLPTSKHPNPPDKYNLQSVVRHYSSFAILDDFC